METSIARVGARRWARSRVTVRTPRATHGKAAPGLAHTLAPFAAMALAVYDKPGTAIDTGSAFSWRRSKRPADKPTVEHQTHGLKWGVWVDDAGHCVRVALVFRGTERWTDWLSNLHFFIKPLHLRDQYVLAREVAQRVVQRYRKAYAGRAVKFYSAGHSLGGGLAQHVLYWLPQDFDHAYAFDPSPVTGFDDLSRAQKQAYFATNRRLDLPRIYRVYESGEVLAYLRRVLKWVYPVSGAVHEVCFSLEAGDPLKSHNMTLLARGIWESAAGV